MLGGNDPTGRLVRASRSVLPDVWDWEADAEVEVEMDGDVLWGIPGSTDACSEDSGMVGRLDGTFVGANSMAGKQVMRYHSYRHTHHKCETHCFSPYRLLHSPARLHSELSLYDTQHRCAPCPSQHTRMSGRGIAAYAGHTRDTDVLYHIGFCLSCSGCRLP